VTLMKGSPLKLSDNALFIGTQPLATTIADEQDFESVLARRIRKEIPQLDVVEIGIKPSDKDLEKLIKKAANYDQIIFTSYNANVYLEQVELMNALGKLGQELHVFAMRNPYDLYVVENIQNYVAFYEYTPHSMEAVVAYLKGAFNPHGKAPLI